MARGLVGRRSYLLGLIYENPSPNYVVELQRGALDRLHGEKYRLLVLPVESVDKAAGKIMSILRASALDGGVLAPPASDHPPLPSALARHHFPFSRVPPTLSLEPCPSHPPHAR